MTAQTKVLLRDMCNRDDSNATFSSVMTIEQAANYLNGPLRRDMWETDGLDEVIAQLRAGDIEPANQRLNQRAAVYLSWAD